MPSSSGLSYWLEGSSQASDISGLLFAAASHRMWALQRLRKLLTTEFGQSININRLLGENDGETRTLVRSTVVQFLDIGH